MLFSIHSCMTWTNQRMTLRFPLLERCSLKLLLREPSVGKSCPAPAWVTGWIPGLSVATVSGCAGCSCCLAAGGRAHGISPVCALWVKPSASGLSLQGPPRECAHGKGLRNRLLKNHAQILLKQSHYPQYCSHFFLKFSPALWKSYFQLISQLLKYKNISLGGTSRLNKTTQKHGWQEIINSVNSSCTKQNIKNT